MKIVIFGGTGFLGEALVESLYIDNDITVVARNEGKLIALKNKYPLVTILTGDISDMHIVDRATQGKDRVYLLSAIKGVDIAENQPYETCKTNIIGVMNVIDCALKYRVSYVLFTSTDKAAQVSGVYGATKLIGEALFREAQSVSEYTQFRVARYGNVWASSASFITKWIPKIKNGEVIYLTEPDMTRFFFTREQALVVLMDCIQNNDATPYIPKMKAMRMGDIVEALKDIYGDVKVEIIGNRGGENMHETMDGKIFSNEVERYSIEEIKEKFLKDLVI